MARSPKPSRAKRKRTSSLHSNDSCNSNTPHNDKDSKVMDIPRVLENVRKYTSVLKNIQRVPGFGTLPQALRGEIAQKLALSTSQEHKVVIVGESGSGKSTTINALLNRIILPTDSSGDACTAIAIEIHSTGTGPRGFYGKIKFVSKESWRDELQQLQDLLRDESSSSDEVKELLEKMSLVYPSLTPSNFKEMSLDTIISSNETSLKLGTEQILPDNNWDLFIAALYEHTVPSRKKFQLWPLVDMAQVYIDSPALDNGLILVDVPGILDANQTRTDRAEQYVRSSQSICIVAPAQRSGSNGPFYKLLHRVLELAQYSGHLDQIILVNSKFDDFDTDELRDRFKNPEIEEARKRKLDAEQDLKILSEKREKMDQALEYQQQKVNNNKNYVRAYKGKLTSLNKGSRPVYDSPIHVDRTQRAGEEKKPLTLSIVQDRIARFEADKLEAEVSARELEIGIGELEAAHNQKQSQHQHFRKIYTELVLRERTTYIGNKQRNQFIKTLKQVNEAAIILTHGNDSAPINEEDSDEAYEQIKAQVPIFNVSAKTYIHLRIRPYDGFQPDRIDNAQDTDIPAFRERLRELAKSARVKTLGDTLKDLTIALGSVHIHVMEKSTSQPLDRNAADQAMSQAESLRQELHGHFKESLDTISPNLESHLRSQFDQKRSAIIKTVVQRVVEKLKVYGEYPTTKKPTGLYPQEYKATVCGKGVWAGSRRKLNFNSMIARRLETALHALMKRLFLDKNSYSEQQLYRCIKSCLEKFEMMHGQMREVAVTAGVSEIAFNAVEDQFKERQTDLQRIHNDIRRMLKEAPSDAGQGLTNQVKGKMLQAYGRAQALGKGRGMLANMSTAIITSVQQQNGSMIRLCVKEFEEELREMNVKAIKKLRERLDVLSSSIIQNYEDAFSQRNEYSIVSDDSVTNQIRGILVKSGLISRKALMNIDTNAFANAGAYIKEETDDNNVEMEDEGDAKMANVNAINGLDAEMKNPVEKLDASVLA